MITRCDLLEMFWSRQPPLCGTRLLCVGNFLHALWLAQLSLLPWPTIAAVVIVMATSSWVWLQSVDVRTMICLHDKSTGSETKNYFNEYTMESAEINITVDYLSILSSTSAQNFGLSFEPWLIIIHIHSLCFQTISLNFSKSMLL